MRVVLIFGSSMVPQFLNRLDLCVFQKNSALQKYLALYFVSRVPKTL